MTALDCAAKPVPVSEPDRIESRIISTERPTKTLVDRAAGLAVERILRDMTRDSALLGVMRDAIRRVSSPDGESGSQHAAALGAQLESILREVVASLGEGMVRASGGLASWQIRTSLETIEERLDRTIALQMLAAKVGLSIKHFGRAFKHSLGITPHRWILRRRVQRVCELLTDSNETLAAIACQSGFADQSHMTAAFRKQMNVTPSFYRRATRSGVAEKGPKGQSRRPAGPSPQQALLGGSGQWGVA